MQPQFEPRLRNAGLLVLVLVLPASVMSYRGIPLIVAIASLLLIAGSWRMRPRDALDRPMVTGLLAFGGLCLVSLAWTLNLREALSFLPWVLAFPALGMALLAARPLAPQWSAAALAAALVLAAALLVTEQMTGLALHRIFAASMNPSKMNQSAVVLAIWAWPVLALLRQQRGSGIAVACFVAVALALLLSESESAKLGLAAGALVWAVFQTGWRWLVPAYVLGLGLLVVMQPLASDLMSHLLTPAAFQALKEGHAQERLFIWTGFSGAVWLKPFLGYGFGSSDQVFASPLVSVLPQAVQAGLRDSHPHNMLLQVWVELGMAGAVLLGFILMRAALLFRQLPPTLIPAAAASLVTALAVALVGYGAWQAWWIAALAPLPLLFAWAGQGAAKATPFKAPSSKAQPAASG